MLQDDTAFNNPSAEEWTDRSRTLVVMSRGVTAQQRRFILEIFSMLPHAKKEFKIDKCQIASQIRQLCQLRKCRQFLYFQTRKKTNFQLYAGVYPSGPTIRFEIDDFMGSGNLKFQGNCIKGSRPIVSFDGGFQSDSLWQSVQLVFSLAFNVPSLHPKSKPCIDHVLSFALNDGTIQFRNYQIFRELKNKQHDVKELYEIGPRMALRPVVVLEGAMCGKAMVRLEKRTKEVRVWKGRARRRGGDEGDDDSQVSMDSEQ